MSLAVPCYRRENSLAFVSRFFDVRTPSQRLDPVSDLVIVFGSLIEGLLSRRHCICRISCPCQIHDNTSARVIISWRPVIGHTTRNRLHN